ncbi:hypothetical protein [Catenuloplanes indicus]|uniref:Uncharacterized protein n=1 Tax=Catenuloplanes indicus TaxID=137267 RepID=A0AAE3W3Q2_9ACTN|nr:hypothetical protein [Catenuloplanes indicus]MDQ0368712.1 hypothetical protein [Catenuloplanes indicus]
MPGFDDALERLVTDPAFGTALSTDPDRALAGYTLTADEAALLRSQVFTGTGDTGHSTVESRTNQSSMFGLLGDIFPADAAPAGPYTAGFGPTGGSSTSLHATGPGAPAAGFGTGPGVPTAGFGAAPLPAQGFGDATTQSFGDAPPPVPDGYATRVDADGDGTWDPHGVRGRTGGGVEILVDRDNDGGTDFTGHDVDADGLIDHADYDTDHDGTPDTRLTDTDDNGWLDTRTRP